jgi:hypothetical protein
VQYLQVSILYSGVVVISTSVLNLVPVGGKLLVTNCYDHFPLVSADRRLIMVSALKV